MDLPEFVLAQIAKDEAVAHLAAAAYRSGLHWEADTWRSGGWVSRVGSEDGILRELWDTEGGNVVPAAAVAIHMARHDPARALADCDAKRRIVELHHEGPILPMCYQCQDAPARWPCETIRLLALPYAGHPDWRDEWRPTA